MRNVIGVLALALVSNVAAAADKPDWAFPVTEKVQPAPRFEGTRVRPAPPGSTLSITRAKADDMYDIPNWFPSLYPSMPKIVQFGNKDTQVRACGSCHLPNTYVNLGVGMPTLVSNFIGDRDIILHGENGILGYGEQVDGDRVDKNIFNAAGEYVSILPGASYFDSVEAFEMARGGRLHTVVLGAYEVDQEGSIANYSVTDVKKGGIGGAMDLIAGKQTLIVMMEHRDSRDRPKLRQQCTYPLTGKACVDVVVTDLAVLKRSGTTWTVEQVADGFTTEEVLELTELDVQPVPTPA